MTERTSELKRPDPDALLAELQQEERRAGRGKLKVFFGAAPGVGKTYAMLEEGRKRAAEGMDVVVGYAEPHARTDTEALLLGMELLPYKFVDYKNVRLKEFDIDAALKRKPALLLVDELAHTNAPGMRHPKRYQDVLEVLDAGIDVYTTLNVQHLESLNDIVERITGIKVRETLPDSILEEADEVELVDISPEELIERLGEGKVYAGEMAERAARNFFNRPNLLALRELALRRTAERVDAQMQAVKRDEAAAGSPWAASERLLVCVSPSPLSARLVRSTKRLAVGLRAPWVAAYVETPASSRLTEQDRRRVDQNLRLAEQLGAQTVVLQGEKVADELTAYAHAHNITKIVIGKPEKPRWRDVLFGSVVDDLVRRSGLIDIYVIRGESEEPGVQPAPPPRPTHSKWQGYAWAVVVTGIATLLGWPLYHGFHLPNESLVPSVVGPTTEPSNTNVLMIYLLGVLFIATRFGRGASTLASFLAVAAFDFFFVKPYLRFSVSDEQYVFTFIVMLATSLTISTLTHRVRLQADSARRRERRTRTVLELTRELAAARTTEQIAAATVRHVSDVLEAKAIVLLPDGDRRLVARGDSASQLDAKESSVAQWAFDHDQPAGAGTGTLPAAGGTYVPMKTTRGAVGVLGIYPPTSNGQWLPEQRQMAESFGSQAALAIERATLAEEARQAWERVEAEFLRNTLLSGVSHELRTPLAGIAGAVSTLIETGHQLSEDSKLEMLDTIYSEAERMERLITNLLDMTRLESGGLHVKKEWQPLQEVIGSALRHMDRRLRGREVKTDIAADLPLVRIDGLLIEQVLANLLDNAVEYTPSGTPIEIEARATEKDVIVRVCDRGPGLPPGTEKRIFEKFFRAQTNETRRGIGLGLAICRGIIEAHGGGISARNRPGGGAVLQFTLPRDASPPTVDHAS
ncbi:MAG TPA: sensor histidine kinase KdpD [Tepidisphaeraceae bacterium]|jgi:two-component system sensor histidine kinase KdpD|nr:sensor histidine kinase KdpD [Tepidisphaeraceae bacterium]